MPTPTVQELAEYLRADKDWGSHEDAVTNLSTRFPELLTAKDAAHLIMEALNLAYNDTITNIERYQTALVKLRDQRHN